MTTKACVRLAFCTLTAVTLCAAGWAAIDPCAASCGSEWQAAKQTQVRALDATLASLDQLTNSCLESAPDDALAASACVRDVNRQRATARTDYRKAVADATTKARDCFRSCTVEAQTKSPEGTAAP
jgi:hypothetical protein